MESLEGQIKTFLSITYCDSWFPAYCYIDSCGLGSGSGYVSSFGSGEGKGFSYGAGCGNGVGSDYTTNDAMDPGDGCGNNNNTGYGDGIKELNGDNVYLIDGIQTIIKSIRGRKVLS